MMSDPKVVVLIALGLLSSALIVGSIYNYYCIHRKIPIAKYLETNDPDGLWRRTAKAMPSQLPRFRRAIERGWTTQAEVILLYEEKLAAIDAELVRQGVRVMPIKPGKLRA